MKTQTGETGESVDKLKTYVIENIPTVVDVIQKMETKPRTKLGDYVLSELKNYKAKLVREEPYFEKTFKLFEYIVSKMKNPNLKKLFSDKNSKFGLDLPLDLNIDISMKYHLRESQI